MNTNCELMNCIESKNVREPKSGNSEIVVGNKHCTVPVYPLVSYRSQRIRRGYIKLARKILEKREYHE